MANKSSGYILVRDVHDGTDGDEGSVGDAGKFTTSIYMDSVAQPSTPTGGNLRATPNTYPTDWVVNPTSGVTSQRWVSQTVTDPADMDLFEKSVSTFNGKTGGSVVDAIKEVGFFDISGIAGTDLPNVNEVSTITTNGLTGGSVVDAIKEVGFFDVSGVAGEDIPNVNEVSTIATNGKTGGSVVDAIKEVGFFDVSGTAGTDIANTNEVSTITTNGRTGGSITEAIEEINTLSIPSDVISGNTGGGTAEVTVLEGGDTTTTRLNLYKLQVTTNTSTIDKFIQWGFVAYAAANGPVGDGNGNGPLYNTSISSFAIARFNNGTSTSTTTPLANVVNFNTLGTATLATKLASWVSSYNAISTDDTAPTTIGTDTYIRHYTASINGSDTITLTQIPEGNYTTFSGGFSSYVAVRTYPTIATKFSINGGDDDSFGTEVSGYFDDASDETSQETQMKSALDAALLATKIPEKGEFALSDIASPTFGTSTAESFTLDFSTSGFIYPISDNFTSTARVTGDLSSYLLDGHQVSLPVDGIGSISFSAALYTGFSGFSNVLRIATNFGVPYLGYNSTTAASNAAYVIEFVAKFNELPTVSSGMTATVEGRELARNMVASSSGDTLTFTYLTNGDKTDATINYGAVTVSSIDGTGGANFTISADSELFDIISGAFTTDSSRASQLTQMKTAFDNATTTGVTGVISGNDFVLTATSDTTTYDDFIILFDSGLTSPSVDNTKAVFNQGFTTAISGDNLVITANVAGVQENILASYTGDGTITVTRTDGEGSSDTATTFTITTDSTHHTPSMTSGTFTDASNGQSVATQLNTAIATVGATVGGYTQITPVLTSGKYVWTATSDSPGDETDLAVTFPVIGSNSTNFDTIPTVNTVTAQGVDEITSGTQTGYEVVINGTTYNGTFTHASDAASQAAQISEFLNSQT